MYAVDRRDEVIELSEIPQSSVGAPLPVIVATEYNLAVSFYREVHDPSWDGTSVRMVDEDSLEPVATVVFHLCYASMFGPPNDEAFAGHPLAARGLKPYGAYLIRNSSWVRALERMNAVHPHHNRERFFHGRNHYVLSFHDSTFECVAESFTIETGRGTLADTVPRLFEKLR